MYKQILMYPSKTKYNGTKVSFKRLLVASDQGHKHEVAHSGIFTVTSICPQYLDSFQHATVFKLTVL